MDRAILRRMPATFHVGLPDLGQRKAILGQILKMEPRVSPDVDLNRLAQLSDGWGHFDVGDRLWKKIYKYTFFPRYSGSDLRELCRTGAVYRLRELVQKEDEEEEEEAELRPITNADLLNALAKMRESKLHCGTNRKAAAENFGLD